MATSKNEEFKKGNYNSDLSEKLKVLCEIYENISSKNIETNKSENGNICKNMVKLNKYTRNLTDLEEMKKKEQHDAEIEAAYRQGFYDGIEEGHNDIDEYDDDYDDDYDDLGCSPKCSSTDCSFHPNKQEGACVKKIAISKDLKSIIIVWSDDNVTSIIRDDDNFAIGTTSATIQNIFGTKEDLFDLVGLDEKEICEPEPKKRSNENKLNLSSSLDEKDKPSKTTPSSTKAVKNETLSK